MLNKRYIQMGRITFTFLPVSSPLTASQSPAFIGFEAESIGWNTEIEQGETSQVGQHRQMGDAISTEIQFLQLIKLLKPLYAPDGVVSQVEFLQSPIGLKILNPLNLIII